VLSDRRKTTGAAEGRKRWSNTAEPVAATPAVLRWDLIEATAPVRICDNGGWTDTWFGGPGRVLNVAVAPGVRVTVAAAEGPDPIVVDVEQGGHRYPIVPGQARQARNNLIEAAIDAYPPPPGDPIEIAISSPIPAGSGTGTSAGVGVALLGALFAARRENRTKDEIAHAAHRLEVDVLGVESGIQDQLSAAFGGINYLEIEPYPESKVEPLPLWPQLGSLLSLVYLGQAHDSSSLHHQVIHNPDRPADVFDRLRTAAVESRRAVLARDLEAFGRAMALNTAAQTTLHPEIVGSAAREVIELVRSVGGLGWKVNGAGGEGGTITILSPTPEAKADTDEQIAACDERYRVIPVDLCPFGLQVKGSL
jgi:D-glycero-alpha-D-manno-heptose-7-phosphate kinase